MGMIGNSLAQGLISGANIQDGTVDTPDLKDSAITTAKVADGAVTNAKIVSGVDASKLTTGTLPIERIADASITASKLAAGAAVPVQTGNSGKFLTTDGTNASWGVVDVTNASNLTTGTLSVARIADGAVTNAKLTNGGKMLLTLSGDTDVINIQGSYTGNPSIFKVGQSSSDGYLEIKSAAGDTMHLTGYGAGHSYTQSTFGVGQNVDTGSQLSVFSNNATGAETYLLNLVYDANHTNGSIRSFNDGGYTQHMRFYTQSVPGTTQQLAMELRGNANKRSAAFFGETYSTWIESVATPDGGTQTVRFIQDCNGKYVLVGRFAANARDSISTTWSSVRGLSTSTDQLQTTEFSADWGTSMPSEVRIMGATDFTRWGDTRTVDFIYRVPNGRQWQYFFNGGNADGTYATPGAVSRKGFNVSGCYDGKGRWNNPNCTQIGMSDSDYANPSSAYTTPTANAFNWHTAADAKLTAHATTGQYSGQDATWTVGFGYDDSYGFFCDEGYTGLDQNTAPNSYSSAVWVLLKFDLASY